MVDDVDIVGGDDLCAVFPVSLVTVVDLGVVGCSDVDTALATEVTDGERKFGSGAEAVEKIYLDAVGREDVGNDFSKFARIVANVMAYDNCDFGQIVESLFQIVGKALGGCTHCIDVHAV